MKVRVIAQTEFNPYELEEAGYIPHHEIGAPEEQFEEVSEEDSDEGLRLEGTYYRFTDEFEQWIRSLPTDADELAEAAGRLCYKSWNRPNPDTATNTGYLANILDHQHFSVLEHASVTFYISGVSRALTHELVRHRHLSYSQVSQRYVDQMTTDAVIPPVVQELPGPVALQLGHEISDTLHQAQNTYGHIFNILRSNGMSVKEARGAARAVLPEATETEIIVTGNHRAWREFLSKRLSPAADAEIRDLANLILHELKKYAPNCYQDFKEEE